MTTRQAARLGHHILLSLSFLLRLVSLGTLLLIILLLLPYLFSYLDNASDYPYIQLVRGTQQQVEGFLGPKVKEYVPTQVHGHDRTKWFIFAGLFLVMVSARRVGERLWRWIDFSNLKADVEKWKAETGVSEHSEVAQALSHKLESLKMGDEKDREELLQVFAEAKRKLARMGRELAFLSIDVVGSAAMKETEESAAIEYTFKEYKRFIEEILQTHGVLKMAWTPDGVMTCFSSIDAAVEAGKNVIRSLEGFNQEIKLIGRDFRVRCGVNAGYVYIDDSVPLQEVSDRTIDIAGHMQKHAEPNTVAIARNAIEPLRGREGFAATDAVVDGYQVYAWRPA